MSGYEQVILDRHVESSARYGELVDMLTGEQIRAAFALLRWTRHDLRRTTALPSDVVDRVLSNRNNIDTTLAGEVVVRDALQRAGVGVTADGPRLRRTRRMES